MHTTREKGFTIVEVMLFLAITGMIMAALLVGWGTQLNQQRYSDAGSSLLTYIRGQYNLVANVNNSREGTSGTTSCDSQIERGTADCTLVGRIIQVAPASGGGTINSTRVLATVDVAGIDQLNKTDLVILDNMALTAEKNSDGTGTLNSDRYSPMWSTSVYTVSSSSPPQRHDEGFSILIVRMPNSGVIRTLVSYDGNATPVGVVGEAQMREFLVCIDSNGLVPDSRPKFGVRIGVNAANAGAVEAAKPGACV